MSTVRTRLVLAGILLASAGCHTMRFTVREGVAGETATRRNDFFLAGLAPTRDVDAGAVCPRGTLSVEEKTTALDSFIALGTLGIYTPRTAELVCAADARGEEVR